MNKFGPIDKLLFVLAIAGLSVSVFLSGKLERMQPDVSSELEASELSLQGEKLKGYVFGFEGLIADWYWMRSLQYIGDKLSKSKDRNINIDDLRPLDPKLLYPLIDNATTLDPHFTAAFSYGATVLPAIDKSLAIKIAEKGIKNNPEQWRFYHQLAFIYWKLGDFQKSADIYEKGSKIDGAPEWMKAMVARMKTQGGSRETAREIYKQIVDASSDAQSKEAADLRLKELDSFDERDALDSVLTAFKKSNGRCASNWQEVFSLLEKVKLPHGLEFRINAERKVVDPTDVPYLIDNVKCVSALDFEKSKLPKG